MSVIYIGAALMAIFGIVSMAVDVGRIRVGKGQMQTAADAAAMAAALGIPFQDYADIDSRAINTAAANVVTVDNVAVALQSPADIEYGIWNETNRTFTLLSRGNGSVDDPRHTANAIRVSAHRTSARGNALPMTFARIVGKDWQDLNAVAVAMVRGGPINFGIVGITAIGSNGNKAVVDSYLPSLGRYEQQPRRDNASVASNGDINLINGDIYGDVRWGVGRSLSQGPNSMVTGWKSPLLTPMVFPPVSVPGGTTPLPKTNPLPGGTLASPMRYVVTGNWNPPKTYTVNGAVEIYVTGSISIKGNSVIRPSDYLPANLKVFVTGTGGIDIKGGSSLYAHVYAPNSTFESGNGNTTLYGRIVAGTVNFKGTGDIHYDESLTPTPQEGYTAALVK